MVSAQDVLLNIGGRDSLSNVIQKPTNRFKDLQKESANAKESVDKVGSSSASVSKVGDAAKGSGTQLNNMETAAKNAGLSVQQISAAAAKASGSIDKIGDIAKRAGLSTEQIGAAASHASTNVGLVGSTAKGSGKQLDNMGASGKNAGGQIASGAKNATNALEGVNSVLTQVLMGYSALEMAKQGIGGAMQKDTDTYNLSKKYGADAGKQIVASNQQIVADLPGDDLFMNSLLSGLAYKTGITDSGKLREAGTLAADYVSGSVQQGYTIMPENAEREIKQYLMTGDTGLMIRGSMGEKYREELEKAKTPAERLVALQKMLNAEQAIGASTAETTANKWDMLKGKWGAALTTIGDGILKVAEPFIDFLLEADEKTGGLSTTVMAVVTGVGLLAGSVAMIKGPIGDILGTFKKIGGVTGDLGKKKVPCPSDCSDTGVDLDGDGSSGSKKGKTSSKSKGKTSSKSKTGRLGGIRGRLGGIGGRIKGFAGRFGGLGGLLGDEVGAIGVGGRSGGLGGRLGGLGGRLGGLVGKGAGGLGKLAGLAGGAARFLGPVGLAVTAGSAAYGAWDGWNNTKGDKGEKFKGAVGGAVEQLSMGLVNKDQVVGAQNWLLSESKKLGGKVQEAGGGILKAVSQPFVDGYNSAKTTVSNGMNTVTGFFTSAPGKIRGGLRTLTGVVVTPFRTAINGARTYVNTGLNRIKDYFWELPGNILQTTGELFSSAATTGQSIVTGITGTITGLPQMVWDEMMRVGQSVLNAGGELYNWAVDTGTRIVQGLKEGLGIGSPGFMYYMVQGELTGIGGLFDAQTSILGTGTGNMGAGMVSGLKGTLGFGGLSTSNRVFNINNQINIDGSKLTVSELETTLLLLLEKYGNKVISTTPLTD